MYLDNQHKVFTMFERLVRLTLLSEMMAFKSMYEWIKFAEYTYILITLAEHLLRFYYMVKITVSSIAAVLLLLSEKKAQSNLKWRLVF